MTFQIVDNIELPAPAPRTRTRNEFSQTVDALEVGQGFQFEDKRELKAMYPAVAPKKFAGKKFRLGLVKAAEAEGELNTFVVKRVS